MGRKEINTADTKIEQKGAIDGDIHERGSIVRADEDLMKAIADDLAFMEQPVTILIARSNEKNSPDAYFCAVNGHNPEILINGKWRTQPVPYVPVNERLTLKRKYVEVLLRAKVDDVDTYHQAPGEADPRTGYIQQRINRKTSAFASFSILEDRDPRAQAWVSELTRQNY